MHEDLRQLYLTTSRNLNEVLSQEIGWEKIDTESHGKSVERKEEGNLEQENEGGNREGFVEG